jgi:carboxyl-terminal processing protease
LWGEDIEMKRMIASSKLTVAIVMMLIFVLYPLTYVQGASSDGKIPDEIYFLLQMENFLKTNYVGDIDDLELLRGAIKGMVE